MDINYEELDLPYPASSMMNYHDWAVHRIGDTLLVGYISDDEECENPLTDCDGMGRIYTSKRFDDTNRDMQEALALDGDWEPALELVEDFDEYRTVWTKAGMYSTEIRVNWDELDEEEQADYPSLGDFTLSEFEMHPDSYNFDDAVRLAVWQKLRDAGKIGDPDVVSLDVYEHGGTAYSLSGEGMQCQWDTARGGAVWVPDDETRKAINQAVAEDETLDRQEVAKGYCRPVLLTYNDWLNGNCYGWVVAKFEADGEDWTLMEDDACWGCIGDDFAMEEATREAAAEAKRLRKEDA